MNKYRSKYSSRTKQRGQSFVELLLIVLVLALMLAGVVEFGFMLNSYIHAISGAREAARVFNSYKAFDPATWQPNEDFYYRTAEKAASAMLPIQLDPGLGDDIVISVLGVRGSEVRRFPQGTYSSVGWSLCAHYTAYSLTYTNPVDPLQPPTTPPAELSNPAWQTCAGHISRIDNDEIRSRAGAGAMQSGLLLVEIFYNYPQMLKLPVFSGGEFMGTSFTIIPDPIPLYAYTIMPMSSAEPTRVP
jgi:hypothetical protein